VKGHVKTQMNTEKVDVNTGIKNPVGKSLTPNECKRY